MPGHGTLPKLAPGRRKKLTDSEKWQRIAKRSERVDPSVAEDGYEYLLTSDKLDHVLLSGLTVPSDWILDVRKRSTKLGRKQHLQLIAKVYATYSYLQKESLLDTAIELIASKIGKKPTKRTDALQVLVEGLISYGGNTKAEQRLARRLYNRDVQAIKHLISKKVTPSNVVAMGLMPGEGLDSWSRQNSKPRKLKKPKPRDKGYFLEIIYLTEEGGTECRARLELTDVTDKRLETFIAAFSPSFSLKTMANSSRPSNVSSDEEDEDAEPDS